MADVPPDLIHPYASGPDCVADIWLGPAEAASRPAVAFFHGGFWRPTYDRVHARPLCAALRGHGWTVISAEYRRSPGNPDATVSDVAAALTAVPRLLAGGPYNGKVIVVGHSAGGHLALWAASAAAGPTLAGVLALAPVADLLLAEELRLGVLSGRSPQGESSLVDRWVLSGGSRLTLARSGGDVCVAGEFAEGLVERGDGGV